MIEQDKTEDKINIEIVEEVTQKEKDEWVIIDPKSLDLPKRDYRKETLLSNRETRNEIIANLFEVKKKNKSIKKFISKENKILFLKFWYF